MQVDVAWQPLCKLRGVWEMQNLDSDKVNTVRCAGWCCWGYEMLHNGETCTCVSFASDAPLMFRTLVNERNSTGSCFIPCYCAILPPHWNFVWINLCLTSAWFSGEQWLDVGKLEILG